MGKIADTHAYCIWSFVDHDFNQKADAYGSSHFVFGDGVYVL